MPRRRLVLVATATLVALVASGADARTSPQRKPARAKDASLLRNGGFDGSLAGWAGWQSTLTLVPGGLAGSTAARVTVKASAKDFSIFTSPRPVASTIAGATYTATGSVRSAVGAKVCLVVREWAGASVAGTAQGCRAATLGWLAFPKVAYAARAGGRTLDVYAYVWGSRAGDSFEVDGLALTSGAAVTEPEPPPPLPTIPVPAGTRPYAATSEWNTRIPAGAAVDGGSGSMVQTIVTRVNAAGWPVSHNAWTVPVYRADAATPRVTVKLTAGWAPRPALRSVPIPAGAKPDLEGDGHLAIIDASTGCEYDFWQAKQAADGSWSASWGNALPLAGSGWYAGGLSARAAGPGLLAGLITPEELRAGVIDHALAFSHNAVRSGSIAGAATEGSGATGGGSAIPYGARVQLDPALDLDSLGLAPWQRTIARALQVYGMILVDQGGFANFAAAQVAYAGNPYAGLLPAGDYAYMPKSLAAHLRVLDTQPLRPSPKAAVVPNGCNLFG